MIIILSIYFNSVIIIADRRSESTRKRKNLKFKNYRNYYQCPACGEIYKNNEYRKHVQTCQGRACDNCNHIYTVRIFNNHIEYCKEKTKYLAAIEHIEEQSDFNENQSFDSSMSSVDTSDKSSSHITDSINSGNNSIDSSQIIGDDKEDDQEKLDVEHGVEEKSFEDDDLYHADNDSDSDDSTNNLRMAKERFYEKKRQVRKAVKIKNFFTEQLSYWEKTLKLSAVQFIGILLQWTIEVAKIKLVKAELDRIFITNGYIPLGSVENKILLMSTYTIWILNQLI